MRNSTPLIGTALLAAALALAPLRAGAEDGNPFVREDVFEGPSDVLWQLLTTEPGIESWLAPHAQVDLRVGGFVKTNHEADGKIGDRTTLVNRVLALSPGRSVTVKVTQAPDGYPFANFVEGTSYEVVLSPIAKDRTRLRCVGHGLPTGYAAYMVRPMFDKAADMVFDHLRAAMVRETDRRAAERRAAEQRKAASKSSGATSKSSTTKPPKTTR